MFAVLKLHLLGLILVDPLPLCLFFQTFALVTFRNSGKIGSIAFRRLSSSKNKAPEKSDADSDEDAKFGNKHSPHQIFLNVEAEKSELKPEEIADIIQGMGFCRLA